MNKIFELLYKRIWRAYEYENYRSFVWVNSVKLFTLQDRNVKYLGEFLWDKKMEEIYGS